MHACMHPCIHTGASGGSLRTALEALGRLSARYDEYTSAERQRTLAWLCAWVRLSNDYLESLQGVGMEATCVHACIRTGASLK